jgi:hypothetical protein
VGNQFSCRLDCSLSNNSKLRTEIKHSSFFHQSVMEVITDRVSSIHREAVKAQLTKDLTATMVMAEEHRTTILMVTVVVTRIHKDSGCYKNSNSKSAD